MLHHIEIYVSNLSKTTRFWSWLLIELGFTLFQEWEKGISWKFGHTYIVFVQVEEKYKDMPYHRCSVGLNHLAFHARSKSNIDELTEKLAGKGISILYPDRHPYAGGKEHYAVYFEDPDRIKVELVAPEIDCGGKGDNDVEGND